MASLAEPSIAFGVSVPACDPTRLLIFGLPWLLPVMLLLLLLLLLCFDAIIKSSTYTTLESFALPLWPGISPSLPSSVLCSCCLTLFSLSFKKRDSPGGLWRLGGRGDSSANFRACMICDSAIGSVGTLLFTSWFLP